MSIKAKRSEGVLWRYSGLKMSCNHLVFIALSTSYDAIALKYPPALPYLGVFLSPELNV